MASNDLLLVMLKINEIDAKISTLSARMAEIEKYIDERMVPPLNELIQEYNNKERRCKHERY